MNVPATVGVPLINIALEAQSAVTPAGSPDGVPMPVAPAVTCVITGRPVFIQRVGVAEAVSAKHSDLSLYKANFPLEVSTGLKVEVVSST